MNPPFLLTILGPTASGKSSVAEAIAEQHDAAILNGDAFQVYRGMNIGTAKPTDTSRYELLDLKNPDEDFGVGEYVLLAAERLNHHYANGRNVILCGGTGLYIRALIEEYKDLRPAPSPELRRQLNQTVPEELRYRLETEFPEVAAQTDLNNPIRVSRALERALSDETPIQFSIPPFSKKKLGIVPETNISELSIAQRTSSMLQNDWVSEVKQLLSNGYGPGNPGFRAIGYNVIVDYIHGEIEEDILVETIISETRQYAKRQRTWLRSEPRLEVYSSPSEAIGATNRWIESMQIKEIN